MSNSDDLRLDEERLELLLSLDKCPEHADEESRELFGFVQACREVANAPSNTELLVSRSLSISTREDLSWRGDVRDLTRFVGDRLRSSAALRLAAASLLLHLAALPVVAFYVLTEEPAVPEFAVDVSNRSAPFDAEESPEPDHGLEIADPIGADTLLVDNSLSWARYQLDSSRLRAGRIEWRVPSWLSPRFGVLYGQHLAVPGAGEPFPSEVLSLELLLDNHLVGPRGAAFSEEAVGLLNQVAGSFQVSDLSSAWLAASALARAESYGLSTPSSASALALARERLPQDDPRRPLIEVSGDVRAMMPLDSAWLDAVRAYDTDSAPEGLIKLLQSVGPISPR
jgi:hypothetical protein